MAKPTPLTFLSASNPDAVAVIHVPSSSETSRSQVASYLSPAYGVIFLLGKIVKACLSQPDAEENGWVLDGYPRSLSQANALQDLGVRPDMFILLEVAALCS
ncbi:hypothetical protein OPV22_028835 [Ensete ventricosum]|uniref:Adenylate kinase n=1 Tax=Ensete ventricosum TaxID=4639 RepID=A0AAV8PZC2_ENSVE|nr:hypothetical protein OPV22_028835 [Ensete ventricosum]